MDDDDFDEAKYQWEQERYESYLEDLDRFNDE